MNLPGYIWNTDATEIYPERVELVEKAAQEVKKEGPPGDRIAVLAIDCQVCFCHPKGSLYVPGAEKDMERAGRWVYKNADKIEKIFASVDYHKIFQVFHPAFWVNDKGENPPPMTVITEIGEWKPVNRDDEKFVSEYLEKLSKGGKYALTIWPYHGLANAVNGAIMPFLSEAFMFHTLVSGRDTEFIQKGNNTWRENYSIFEPEVQDLGSTSEYPNIDLFTALTNYDKIYVFGEASSHCVLASLQSIERENPKLLEKIILLTDATSPVPAPPLNPLPENLNFPKIANSEVKRLQSKGLRTSTTEENI